MKNQEIMNVITRKVGRAFLGVKKHSPELLLGLGLLSGAATIYHACKATTKVNVILDEAKETIDIIHKGIEDGKIREEECSKEDGAKALTVVYAKTGVELFKLYAPAIGFGLASVTCVLASHNIIRQRNVALAAAYATIDNGFKEYRGRVIERFGEELDRELKYNIKAKEIEEIVTDENGEETVVKKTIEVAEPNIYSMYARCFDETCIAWERDSEMNLYFLRQVEQWATEKLRRQGHLTLNEVYEKLGFQKTRAGAEVGWVYDNSPNPIGDNRVDFFIYDLHDERKRAFVNGYEKSIWVDFNVDGYILDHI